MTQKKDQTFLLSRYRYKERIILYTSRYEYCAKKSNSNAIRYAETKLYEKEAVRPKHQSDDIGALTTFLSRTKNASF